MAKVGKLIIDDKTREKWENIDPEDYPLLMVEYSRQTMHAVQGINNWMTFVGVVLIISLMITVLEFLF